VVRTEKFRIFAKIREETNECSVSGTGVACERSLAAIQQVPLGRNLAGAGQAPASRRSPVSRSRAEVASL